MPNDAAIKAALLQTTGTMGWKYVKQIFNAAVQKAAQAALDEDDPVKGEAKRLRASGMQKGIAEIFQTIESFKNWDEYNEFDLEQLEKDIHELAREAVNG